jgi:hypothetical protein
MKMLNFPLKSVAISKGNFPVDNPGGWEYFFDSCSPVGQGNPPTQPFTLWGVK